jgi:hypothetical protein
MISREELIKRGARFKDGSKVEDLKKEEPVPSTPLVAETTIDMTPVAEAVKQLSDVVKTALESQRPILEKIVEKQSQQVEKKSPPEEWEFTIARDARGRMESIKAKAIS